MSSIYRLQIRGIRSFDPEKSETIQFGCPLTLICGSNGSGKTTIIECLKYATTGDLPPNSKGGAFIHDPHLTGERETTAIVKLGFTNANGASMITSRTMQLQVKKTAVTVRTLEGTLSALNKGEKTSISTKCAELDTQIPLYLGVTRALLDYVIFCHQEDSLWPLSEPSVLKKRFDEIFQAMKFTRVLENLKILKKNMDQDVKILKNNVEHMKVEKERAKRTRLSIQQIETQIVDITNDIDRLGEVLEKNEADIQLLFESNQQYEQVLSEFESFKRRKTSLEEQTSRLELSIGTILPESDDQLANQLANFEQILLGKQREVQIKKREHDKLMADLKITRDEYNKAIRLEGEFKGKEEIFQQNLQKRAGFVASHQHVDVDSVGERQIREYDEELKRKLNHHINFLKELRLKNRENEQKLNNSLRAVQESQTREKQSKIHSLNDIKNYEKQVKTVNTKLEGVQFNDGAIEYEKSQLEELVEKLGSLKNSESTISELIEVIRSDNNKLVSLENEVDDLNKKLALFNKQSDVHAKLSLLRGDCKHRLNAVNSIIHSQKMKFLDVIGVEFDLSNFQKVWSNCVSSTNETLESVRNNYQIASQNLKELETIQKGDEARLGGLKREKELAEKTVYMSYPEDSTIDEYEDIIKELEISTNRAYEQWESSNSIREFNKKAIYLAETERKCKLCNRGFHSNEELSSFFSLLKQITEKSDDQLKESYESEKSDLEVARGLQGDIITIRKNVPLIDGLNKRIEQQKIEISEAKTGLLKLLAELEAEQEKLESVESLNKPLNDLLRMNGEVETIQQQINTLEGELTNSSLSNSPPLSNEDVQKRLSIVNQELRNLRRIINDNVELKETKQNKLSKIENSIKDKKLSISQLERSSIERNGLMKNVEEYKSKITELKLAVNQIESIFGELETKEQEINKQLESLKEENSKIEGVEVKKVEDLETNISTFSLVQAAISTFLEFDSIKLKENGKLVLELEDKIGFFELEIAESLETIRSVEKLVNEADNVQTNIRNNLDLRQLRRECDEIEDIMGKLDIERAMRHRGKYQEETLQLRKKSNEFSSEQSSKMGQMYQMKIQMENLNNELKSEYKDIDQKYHKEYLKLQTNHLASNDLLTYSKALDNAIMKYHSIKMKEINRITDELWKKTYTGTDVDTIMIRSDVNIQSKGNRSYNYRVVMVKQGVELDMRGRCSAGQKVLACIIIRLALAECFGVNCGMIALDEPTTNLDVGNIESLAKSLNSIIDSRRSQRNFQLIVITHDEKFLHHINGDQFTDHFFRVSRDASQKSEIRKLPINLINEE